MSEMYVVRDDATLCIMDDLTDDDILDMDSSGLFILIFRVIDGKVSSAEVYDNVDGVVWEPAKRMMVK